MAERTAKSFHCSLSYTTLMRFSAEVYFSLTPPYFVILPVCLSPL